MSSGLKALKYAEDNLGVHRVHEEAVAYRNGLDEVLTELSDSRDHKRDLELQLHDREMQVAAAEYGKHPDMAQTRMDKHLKQALSQDAGWRELRNAISKVTGKIEGLDYDRAILEADIKIAVARLQELGGYLTYLAAIKQAENSYNSSQTGSPT